MVYTAGLQLRVQESGASSNCPVISLVYLSTRQSCKQQFVLLAEGMVYHSKEDSLSLL
jgi:hypothetical protein